MLSTPGSHPPLQHPSLPRTLVTQVFNIKDSYAFFCPERPALSKFCIRVRYLAMPSTIWKHGMPLEHVESEKNPVWNYKRRLKGVNRTEWQVYGLLGVSRGAASKALSKEGFHLVFASLVQFIDSPSIECFVDADHTLSASFFCPVGRSDTPLSWISLSDFFPNCCCCWAIC